MESHEREKRFMANKNDTCNKYAQVIIGADLFGVDLLYAVAFLSPIQNQTNVLIVWIIFLMSILSLLQFQR